MMTHLKTLSYGLPVFLLAAIISAGGGNAATIDISGMLDDGSPIQSDGIDETYGEFTENPDGTFSWVGTWESPTDV